MGRTSMKISYPRLKEEILKRVSEEDIFRFYFPGFIPNKVFCNKYRSETSPSAIIGTKPGWWWMQDYGDDNWCGNVWTIVSKIENSSSYETLEIIDERLQLGIINKKVKLKPIVYDKPVKTKKPKFEYPKIQIVKKEWDSSHYEYWRRGGLSKDDLYHSTLKVYAVEKIYYNGQSLGPEDFTIAYYNSDIDRFKIYRPYADKKERDLSKCKWLSNIPYEYLFNIENVKGCEEAFLSKSYKEFFLLKKLLNTDCIVVTQAEGKASITEANREILKKIPSKYSFTDTDNKGDQFGEFLEKYLGFCNIQIPRELSGTDLWDWAELAGHGPILDYLKKQWK